MAYRFYTADVFTDRIFGGNPLAVFPDARGLDGEHMQRIAREVNLSETVFVLPPEDAANTRRLRIFTPSVELPFAGHPTVGTAFVLATLGEITLDGVETRIIFEEGVGPVPVTIRAAGGKPVFTQLSAARMPEFGPEPPAASEIAEMLSLEPSDLSPDVAPQAVSCGVPFLFVPLAGREALGRVRIRHDVWEAVLADHWAPHVFALTDGSDAQGIDLQARMFAPAMGIEEDPATGAAATALAGFLAGDQAADGTLRWRVAQGVEMGRPSVIEVETDIEAGAITAIRVGGGTVLVSHGEMTVPEAG